MPAARRAGALTVLWMAILSLVGCGQRGDLYLPTPKKSTVPPVSAPCDSSGGSRDPAAPPCQPATNSGTR